MLQAPTRWASRGRARWASWSGAPTCWTGFWSRLSRNRLAPLFAAVLIAAALITVSATTATAERTPSGQIRLQPAAQPVFSVLSLEITPAGQRDFCSDLDGVNDPLDLQSLALEEQHVLRLVMLASDADGDPLTILPPTLSATVDSFGYTINGDTLAVVIDLGEGAVTLDNCERLGDLVITVREDTSTGQTYSYTLGFYGMWAGADLGVRLEGVAPSYPLGAVAAIWGTVRAVAGGQYLSSADDFVIHIVITTPTGLEIGNSDAITGDFIPHRIEAPRVTFIDPGQYEARLYFVGRDLNPDNNDQRIPFTVGSGPFQVYPNAITPNGDGANDEVLFRFENQAVTRPSVKIFTLDGEQIFATDQMQGSRIIWDGRDDQGRLVPPGSYLYVVYDEGRTMDRGICAVVR